MISLALARQLPMRTAAGAFVLTSGLSKRRADEETAKRLHGFATATYPFLGKLEPQQFVTLLSAGEIATGAVLLLPMIPAVVAGATLTGFAGGLIGAVPGHPGMREKGLRPTEQGIPLAKDVWLLGIGLSLLVDSVGRRGGEKR